MCYENTPSTVSGDDNKTHRTSEPPLAQDLRGM